MDSIVREVVSRSGVQPRLPESPTQRVGVDAEDAELERILASLRTNIKIVGRRDPSEEKARVGVDVIR